METIQEGKQYLRENWEKGTACPCCGQRVQVYKYKLFATSALALIDLYLLKSKRPSETYFHVREWAEARPGRIRAPHFAEMRFWGLIVPLDRKTKEDNSQGFWAMTEKGDRFVRNKLTVQERVHIFNNKLQGFSGKEISIREALSNEFNYQELMGVDDSASLF